MTLPTRPKSTLPLYDTDTQTNQKTPSICTAMPLHLLGKKSWNVYNTVNIEKVKRDEAAAAAREEEQDRLTQEQDALRRTALLRGEVPPTFASEVPSSPSQEHGERGTHDVERSERKRQRKHRGEDDTDHAIRLAQQNADTASAATLAFKEADRAREQDLDIVDHKGHIQLFAAPDEKALRKTQKNAELESEKARKKKELEDQYTMRLANAGGYGKDIASRPWYAVKVQPAGSTTSALATAAEDAVEGKNVWGRPDPGRKTREEKRMGSADPFAAMQKAQSQLRQAEKDKEAWKTEHSIALAREMALMDEAYAREKAERRSRRRHGDRRDKGMAKDGSRDERNGGGKEDTRDSARRKRPRSPHSQLEAENGPQRSKRPDEARSKDRQSHHPSRDSDRNKDWADRTSEREWKSRGRHEPDDQRHGDRSRSPHRRRRGVTRDRDEVENARRREYRPRGGELDTN